MGKIAQIWIGKSQRTRWRSVKRIKFIVKVKSLWSFYIGKYVKALFFALTPENESQLSKYILSNFKEVEWLYIKQTNFRRQMSVVLKQEKRIFGTSATKNQKDLVAFQPSFTTKTAIQIWALMQKNLSMNI